MFVIRPEKFLLKMGSFLNFLLFFLGQTKKVLSFDLKLSLEKPPPSLGGGGGVRHPPKPPRPAAPDCSYQGFGAEHEREPGQRFFPERERARSAQIF